MKHKMKFAAVLLFALGLASCDMFNVDVASTLSGNLDIQVEEGVAKGTLDEFPFNASTTMGPLNEDDELKDYADKIVAVGVDGIVAEVTYVSEDGAYFHAGSTFTISNGVVNGEYILPDDWLVEVGSTVTLDDLGGFYDDVAAVLTNVEEEFDLAMVGTSSKAGISATVKIDIATTITGNPF